MFESLRGVLASLLDIGATRLELASTELEEERVRLADLLVSAGITLALLGIGVLLLIALIVVLGWDNHRVLTLALLTGAFLAGGGYSGWRWRVKAAAKPRFLAATLQEFQRDLDSLRPAARRAPQGEGRKESA